MVESVRIAILTDSRLRTGNLSVATSPTDPNLKAPYPHGLPLLPILVHKPHPKGIIRIRGFFRLVEPLSLMNGPTVSEKVGDYGQLGAWLLRCHTVQLKSGIGAAGRPAAPSAKGAVALLWYLLG